MNISRYDPWGLRNIAREMERAARFGARPAAEDNSDVVTSQWTPLVDVKEEKDKFVLLADVPGVDPANIEIHMENGNLTIRGERHPEKEEEGQSYTRVERSHGIFYRRFALPDTADPERISARGQHGVLRIEIPKREEVKPRRIEVR